eukprot:6418549-Amphidinium_carterae.2
MSRSQVSKFQCEDLRVLPVRYDGAGERRVSFTEAVASMDGAMPSGGLGLDGPPTCLWLCKHISHHDIHIPIEPSREMGTQRQAC